MPWNDEDLFLATEALRKRVGALEATTEQLRDALLQANDFNVVLARRIRFTENFIKGATHAVERQRRHQVYEEGDEQGR